VRTKTPRVNAQVRHQSGKWLSVAVAGCGCRWRRVAHITT